MNKNRFAKNLRWLRKNDNISQQVLAGVIGKAQTSIGNWENGRTEPSMNELIAIAEFFGLSLHSLICEKLEEIHKVHPRIPVDSFQKTVLLELRTINKRLEELDKLDSPGSATAS